MREKLAEREMLIENARLRKAGLTGSGAAFCTIAVQTTWL